MTSNKRRRHTPDQVIRKLAEGHKLLASGTELDEVCRHLEIAESTWHRWLAQYGGMKANDAKRLRELEAENARLKKLVANQALDIDMLREISSGTSDPEPQASSTTMLAKAASELSRSGLSPAATSSFAQAVPLYDALIAGLVIPGARQRSAVPALLRRRVRRRLPRRRVPASSHRRRSNPRGR